MYRQIDESQAQPGVPTLSPEARRVLLTGLALASAGANVIMQLSRRPIGRGVAESRVDDGALFRHPMKRTRTTLAYVMIALLGSDHERGVLRSEIARQHRRVRSPHDAEVQYDASDPELQRWVAACMFRGLLDAATLLYGAPNAELAEELYRHASRFATTLQVSKEQWPSGLEAFEEYWQREVRTISFDEVTAAYLHDLAALRFLPGPLARSLGGIHRVITTGFLPREFREPLGLAWGEREQRRFHRALVVMRRCNAIAPAPLREFPWNVVLFDTRRRIARGRSVI